MLFRCNENNLVKMADKSVVEQVSTNAEEFENLGVKYNHQLVAGNSGIKIVNRRCN